MAGWFFKNALGRQEYEELSAEQALVDQKILVQFQMLEGEVAKGQDVMKNAAYDDVRKLIAEAVSYLPAQRAAHWRSELARIKIVVVEPKPASTGKDEKPEEKGKSDGGKK